MPHSLPQSQKGILSGNALKLIAAITMLIDHIGMFFFPEYMFLRVIGRLSFPIYAFMIAEGCHYTKNRFRYYLGVFFLGIACQTAYYIASRDTYCNILLTFSCSIVIIYLLQEWKSRQKYWLFLPFTAAIVFFYVVCQYVEFAYGFWGIMVPVFAAILQPQRGKAISQPRNFLIVLFMGISLLILSKDSHVVQYFGLVALPLLLLYSGNRGKGNYKYAFYLFYPLHLVALQVIAWLLA